MLAHEYRLYPTWKQRFQLKHHFGCNRYTYNAFIEICQEHYENGNPLSHFDMCAILTKMKKDPELKWLNGAYAQSLNAALKNLATAFRNLSEGRTQYPKPKNRHGQQSAAYPQGVKIKGKYIYIPKIGWIRFRDNRKIEGKIKTVTVKRTVANEYYASVMFEIQKDPPKPRQNMEEQEVLGVDLGITPFAATSDGEIIFNPRNYIRMNLISDVSKRNMLEHKRDPNGERMPELRWLNAIERQRMPEKIFTRKYPLNLWLGIMP